MHSDGHLVPDIAMIGYDSSSVYRRNLFPSLVKYPPKNPYFVLDLFGSPDGGYFNLFQPIWHTCLCICIYIDIYIHTIPSIPYRTRPYHIIRTMLTSDYMIMCICVSVYSFVDGNGFPMFLLLQSFSINPRRNTHPKRGWGRKFRRSSRLSEGTGIP